MSRPSLIVAAAFVLLCPAVAVCQLLLAIAASAHLQPWAALLVGLFVPPAACAWAVQRAFAVLERRLWEGQ